MTCRETACCCFRARRRRNPRCSTATCARLFNETLLHDVAYLHLHPASLVVVVVVVVVDVVVVDVVVGLAGPALLDRPAPALAAADCGEQDPLCDEYYRDDRQPSLSDEG